MAVRMKGRSTGPTTVELTHESGSIINTMAPKDNRGDGSTFSPTDLCAVSLGACATTIMSLFARDNGIKLGGIDFELVKEMAANPRRIAKLTVKFTISGTETQADYERLVAEGKTCPVCGTIGKCVEIDASYERA
ncbi:MAG: OsmC family protein [Spirochaetales bacterium]|nr:OsmC family protein [Spirochaetales bacterium]